MSMSLKETYNRTAEDFHQDHLHDLWWRAHMDCFIDRLQTGDSVLDLGCGSGVKTNYLAEKGLNAEGADFSESFIAIAKREYPSVPFQVLDLYRIDELNRTFDAIVMQVVLLHVPKKEVLPVLQKIIQKIRIGGLLYIAVKEIRVGQPEEEMKTEHDYGYEYTRFFSYFTKEEIEQLIQDLGMELVEIYSELNGRTNWIFTIARK
jgi:2-polyprenyl-3-methyl-5-hydroxy-6-metoxy-1,4-benzoquinol methylase